MKGLTEGWLGDGLLEGWLEGRMKWPRQLSPLAVADLRQTVAPFDFCLREVWEEWREGLSHLRATTSD